MRVQRLAVIGCAALLLAAGILCVAQTGYLGFDKNAYPGDEAMKRLRKEFRFAGFWLNAPPGMERNPWHGKRALVRQLGFGFLVLYNGRLQRELEGRDAGALGDADGRAAVKAALAEGFPRRVRIFLDIEEGGRLMAEQSRYVEAWIDAVRRGGARAGVYCSGIEVPDGDGRISTASYLERLEREQGSRGDGVLFWVANDQCPPAPGCALRTLRPADGAKLAEHRRIAVWQYAQSPRRARFSAGCPLNAGADGNCYPPAMPHTPEFFVDLNVADSADPSQGR